MMTMNLKCEVSGVEVKEELSGENRNFPDPREQSVLDKSAKFFARVRVCAKFVRLLPKTRLFWALLADCLFFLPKQKRKIITAAPSRMR